MTLPKPEFRGKLGEKLEEVSDKLVKEFQERLAQETRVIRKEKKPDKVDLSGGKAKKIHFLLTILFARKVLREIIV